MSESRRRRRSNSNQKEEKEEIKEAETVPTCGTRHFGGSHGRCEAICFMH